MTVIFPYPNDPQLAPFVEPFGRMMLAYGRAMVAVREIAHTRLGSEEEAVKFTRKVTSGNLVEKVTNLCAPTLPPDRLNELRACCETLACLYKRRNRIVHGEWWFNDSTLTVRDVDLVGEGNQKKLGLEHDETVTPESLDHLAYGFSEVSSDLDMFMYTTDLNNAHLRLPD